MLRAVTLSLVGLAASPSPQYSQNLTARLRQETVSLETLYKTLHQTPELSYHEKATSARIAAELKAAGFDVATGVGGFGVVGVMKNGAGPTVLIRTDLDALPVVEATGLPYASKVKTTDDQGSEVGVMHACGHDVHMTCFVGAARMLNRLKSQWSGTLVMIGQPAEERGGGAKAMLSDGLFTRFPRPDFCLALHTDAALESGKIGYREGFVMANVDSLDITIRGVGGHGAYPHATKDPVVIAAETIMALQTVVSRELRPIDPGVITVGSIHGGAKRNVIPDQVDLHLTIRSYSAESRDVLLKGIERTVNGIARAHGVPAGREPIIKRVEDEYTPATYNTPALIQRLLPAWKKELGDGNVVMRDPEMGGEDYALYGLEEPRIPSVLFRVGTIDAQRMAESRRPGGTPLPSLHSALFWPAPATTIDAGVRAMTAAAMELLRK